MTDLENVETWLSVLRASSGRLAAEVDGLT